MMQWLFAEILGLPERQVRVVCRDVGGSFGLKIHVYGDEIATAAMSMHLGRPVKYIADRLESFVSDVHARDHFTRARMGLVSGPAAPTTLRRSRGTRGGGSPAGATAMIGKRMADATSFIRSL